MRVPTPVAERWNRCSALACVLILAGVAPAQEPVGTLFAVAREKIQQQDIVKSAQLGFGINRKTFSDVPAQGGILVGFDVQLSKFFDYEIVQALKPLYATETGEIGTNEFGDFGAKPGKKKNTNLTRSLRTKAPPGFAVGGITIRSGLYIDGLKLTFNPIKGYRLDTNQAAVSSWIGNDKHGHMEKTIGNNGMPIVGIFGNQDDQRVIAVGIYQISAPVAAAPRQNAQAPALAEKPGLPHPPRPRKADADDRPAALAPKPAVEVPAEAEDAAKNNDAEKAEPKLAVKESSEQRSPWFPMAICVTVSMVVFAGCWLVLGGKRNEKAPPKAERRPEVVKKEPRKTPPPIPRDDEPENDRGTKPRATPSSLPDGPEEILDAIIVPEESTAPDRVPADAFTEKAPMNAPAALILDDAAAEVPSIARTQPPYFHARAVFALKVNRFYRVYVLPDMLLFLDAGPEHKDGYARGVGAAGAATGGLIGGLLGVAIGSLLDSNSQDPQTRKRVLDLAGTEELLRMSEEGAPNFRVAVEDLDDARIEPTSTWHSMQYLGHQYIGLFRFRHPEQGALTLEIPTVEDMKTALAELPEAFGANLDVKVEFDRRGWKYVAKD